MNSKIDTFEVFPSEIREKVREIAEKICVKKGISFTPKSIARNLKANTDNKGSWFLSTRQGELVIFVGIRPCLSTVRRFVITLPSDKECEVIQTTSMMEDE